ncbi:MAG: response regulator [Betaproteobacteria bacterium]|nr:MAG: response regulator [Betaproteobacteria bacterium]
MADFADVGLSPTAIREAMDTARSARPGQSSHERSQAVLRLRIVVADDDPDTVRTLRLLLEDEGHDVKSAGNGQAALDAVRDFGADVLLLDIGMPGLNGYEVAQKLRERYGSAKPTLIAITGRDSDSDKSFARSTGFDHYVSKPYEPRKLLALLEERGRP